MGTYVRDRKRTLTPIQNGPSALQWVFASCRSSRIVFFCLVFFCTFLLLVSVWITRCCMLPLQIGVLFHVKSIYTENECMSVLYKNLLLPDTSCPITHAKEEKRQKTNKQRKKKNYETKKVKIDLFPI